MEYWVQLPMETVQVSPAPNLSRGRAPVPAHLRGRSLRLRGPAVGGASPALWPGLFVGSLQVDL